MFKSLLSKTTMLFVAIVLLSTSTTSTLVSARLVGATSTRRLVDPWDSENREMVKSNENHGGDRELIKSNENHIDDGDRALIKSNENHIDCRRGLIKSNENEIDSIGDRNQK